MSLPDASEAPAESAAELTPRAIVWGCAIGAVLASANVYMGLKTGWNDTGNLTSSILGFALLASLARSAAVSPLEVNILQTTASAAACANFGAGLVHIFPALFLMGERTSGWAIAVFALAAGSVGLLFAILFRRHFVVAETLPFPSGSAAAQLIQTMHRRKTGTMRRAWTLIAVAAAAMAWVWLRDGAPRWIPPTTALAFGIGINWSPMLAGVGMMVGARIALSLLGGSLVAWVVMAPLLRDRVAEVGAWLLWPGVGLIVSTALVSLIWERSSFVGGVRSLLRARPSRGAALALVILAVSLVIGWRLLHLPPLVAILALLFALLFASVNVRAAGETDVTPLTQTAQLTQLGVAPLCSSQPAANVGAAAVGGSAAIAAVSLSYAFKTGHLLGANPRKQIVAQIIGLLVGTAVVVPAYLLVARVIGIGGTTLPAPAAQTTRLLADVVARGTAALPPHAGLATGIACAVGTALALLGRTRVARWLPSGTALGMGFLLQTSFASLTIAVGAMIAWVIARRSPRWSDDYTPSLAAGAIAGEALIGLVIAALVGLAVLRPPPA